MVAISKTSWIKVWDPLVRFGHWTLVIAFAVAYLTGEEEGDASELHEWAGYVVGGIVAWRVVWGLTGPRYARFSDFVTGPIQALRYLWSELTGHARRYLGHSPAGGVMVLALLVSLALTVVTGLIADQGYGNASSRQGLSSVVAQALAGEPNRPQAGHAGQEKESMIGEAHALLANISLALIVFHVLGVALASFVHRENLIRAMITGEKRANEDIEDA
jgi:cytochrome b